ncbi:MAG: tRNA pseudouridine(13) synthase TruD, partial [Halomonadaceae bacterium]
TRQWFSLYRPRGEDAPLLESIAARWKVLEHSRHCRKLRRGDHRGNRFSLRLRECTVPPEQLIERWARIRTQGCPNYFGPQRFGFQGGNLDQAMALKPHQLRGKAGFRSGMYLSAARSWCFNQWLASRVTGGNWQQQLPGDPGLIPGADQPAVPVATGPLAGDGSTGAGEPLLEQELTFLQQWPEFTRLFRETRMQPARRPLVVTPGGPCLSWQGDDPLLEFTLPAGCFATAVLQELVTILDARQMPASPGEAL